MAGRGEALKLGPFVGGMNTASDSTTVADSELVDCINFELDLDGSLVQRPALKEITDLGTNHELTAIGSSMINGSALVYFSGTDGLYRSSGGALTLILANLQSKVALVYRNLVYVVATNGSAVNGGYYNPATDAWTSQPLMPRGESAIFYKSRMFIAGSSSNPSRLQFSDIIVADAFTWTATNIIDVSPGDGQRLVDIVVYNDNLMLFKEDSTYVFAYDLQISDAVLRQVNPSIGASTRYCVASYENSVFVFHEGRVYEISNYNFSHINIKVPFVYDSATPGGSLRYDTIFMSLVGDRLIVRYYNRIYVYGLKTKTWSRWESKSAYLHNFGPIVGLPKDISTDGNIPVFFCGSSINSVSKIFRLADGYDSIYKEEDNTGLITIESTALTKNYDMSDAQHFKKLMWWGADLLTNKDIVALATPVVNASKVTWYELSTYTWNQLSLNTWAAPLLSQGIVETDLTYTSLIPRIFVKFRKTLRFRQLNFKVILKGDGSPATGPARLFSLTAIVSQKQLVAKQVS